MKVEGRFITLLFVTIGFILILSVSLTKGSSRINPDSTSSNSLRRNQRSITVSTTSPVPKLFSVPSSDGKQFEEDGVGKDDESDGKDEEGEGEEPFPDEEKEGEVNGGESEDEEESGEESGDEDEKEEDSSVDGTSSSSEKEERNEGSSSENTDGSSSDISSTSKSSVGTSSDGRVVSTTSKKRSDPSKVVDEEKKSSSIPNKQRKYSFTNCSIDNLNLCSRSLLFYGDPNLIDIPETPLQVARKCK